jgi:hypothetical protein
MTCIIATPKFMAAERRIVADGAASAMRKIGRNKWMIAGCAGLATSTLAVLTALRAGARVPADLLSAVNKESAALVLTASGRLYQIQDGAVWPLPKGLHAVGSGADLALGFLAGSRSTHAAAARRALRYVATRRADCGSGVNLIERT